METDEIAKCMAPICLVVDWWLEKLLAVRTLPAKSKFRHISSTCLNIDRRVD